MIKCDLIDLYMSIPKLSTKELGFYHENMYCIIYICKIIYI